MGEHRAPLAMRPELCGGTGRPSLCRKIEGRVRSMNFLSMPDRNFLSMPDPVPKTAKRSEAGPLSGLRLAQPHWLAPAAATVSGAAPAPSGLLSEGMPAPSGLRAEVAMACVPLMSWALGLGGEPNPEAEDEAHEELQTIQILRCGLAGASIVQTLIAATDFTVGDPISGIMNCGISMLGMHSAIHLGSRYLPSYIVVAFCSGTVQLLLDVENMQLAKFTWATDYVLSNVANLIHLASPVVLFLGVAIGFRLYVELRHLPFDERLEEAAQATLVPLMPRARNEAVGTAQAGFRAFSGPCYRLASRSTTELNPAPTAAPAAAESAEPAG